jgi:hypothetical protein
LIQSSGGSTDTDIVFSQNLFVSGVQIAYAPFSSTPSLIPLTPITSYGKVWNWYRGDPGWDYLDRPAS